MSFTQNNVLNFTVRDSRTFSLSQISLVHISALCISPIQTLQHHKMPRLAHSFPKHKICAPICFFGEKGNSRGGKMEFSWDSLKDALKGLTKGKTVQDMLRDQMRQREYGGDGGDANPPGGGGGSGGSDGTEDEGFAGILNETLQVVLATLAFIFVYVYIIRGAELTKLARDYIKYLLGGGTSMRLGRAMEKWKRMSDKFSWYEESEDWLVQRIVTTPTWWHRPEAIARIAKSKMRYRERN